MSYLCFLILIIKVAGLEAAQIANQTPIKGDKTVVIAEKYAFHNDFDKCMIDRWTNPRLPVLRTSPTAACNTANHSRLCYGAQNRRPDNAQYIACYNIRKQIPEFTAYIVPHGSYSRICGRYRRPRSFARDRGPYAPKSQAKHNDYKNTGGRGENFCSRGHLVPSGVFNTKHERDLTFIMTNVAPQWQPFNGGNWASVERAVKDYATFVGRGVYVFTGTAGVAKNPSTKSPYVVGTGKMVVPAYYWKAVCDPEIKESIVFIAENNVDVTSEAKVAAGTCAGQAMTKKRGVIYCYSVCAAQVSYFHNWWHGSTIPDFHPVNCGTARMGNFLNTYLNFI
ncbi:uncharacterized protein LOC114516219 [Dendronephthya gigantea]|uniref:uncharacterized protein LOC114516219 n=1 Tax=Dendronephthya gigantea TaxID=151771 RepID=UPI001069E572|nr:uncharacterized protein LOC114516219 [Dendronephthya gigantea]